MAISWLEKGHSGSSAPAKGVLISKVNHNHGKKKHTPCAYVRLGKDVMQQCRFVAGDLVRVGLDKESRELCIERTLDSEIGWTLSPEIGKSSTKAMRGQCVSSSFRVNSAEFVRFLFPNHVRRYHAEYTATTDGLIVSIPRQSNA